MKKDEIVSFCKSRLEPIQGLAGEIFRCAAILTDGTYLPCVAIAEAEPRVKLAVKRFDETKNQQPTPKSNTGMAYESIVKTFVCAGNRVNDYDITELQISPYAIPKARLHEIEGETTMGWTEFTAEMDDGQVFRFGTTYLTEFFNMPPGYTADQIRKITPTKRSEFQPRGTKGVFRERPYFTCFIYE